MALKLIEYNVLFVHIPKCGGMWVRKALQSAGIKTKEVGKQHSAYADLHPEELGPCRLVFQFEREAEDWARSFYHMKQLGARRHSVRADYLSPSRVIPWWWPAKMDRLTLPPFEERKNEMVHIYENTMLPRYREIDVPHIIMQYNRAHMPELLEEVLKEAGVLPIDASGTFESVSPENVGIYGKD